jgi:hypothetical protein
MAAAGQAGGARRGVQRASHRARHAQRRLVDGDGDALERQPSAASRDSSSRSSKAARKASASRGRGSRLDSRRPSVSANAVPGWHAAERHGLADEPRRFGEVGAADAGAAQRASIESTGAEPSFHLDARALGRLGERHGERRGGIGRRCARHRWRHQRERPDGVGARIGALRRRGGGAHDSGNRHGERAEPERSARQQADGGDALPPERRADAAAEIDHQAIVDEMSATADQSARRGSNQPSLWEEAALRGRGPGAEALRARADGLRTWLEQEPEPPQVAFTTDRREMPEPDRLVRPWPAMGAMRPAEPGRTRPAAPPAAASRRMARSRGGAPHVKRRACGQARLLRRNDTGER